MKDDIPTVDKTTIVELASDAATGSEFQRDLVRNLICRQARNIDIDIAIPHHWYMYMALAFTVRDHMLVCRAASVHNYITSDARIACCLSAEFLIGPQLACNLLRLDLEKDAREALHAPGQDLDELLTVEEEAGLSNGELGRLAACYLDSLSMLEILATGYSIRYEFGIFYQKIVDGWQVERTDK